MNRSSPVCAESVAGCTGIQCHPACAESGAGRPPAAREAQRGARTAGRQKEGGRTGGKSTGGPGRRALRATAEVPRRGIAHKMTRPAARRRRCGNLANYIVDIYVSSQAFTETKICSSPESHPDSCITGAGRQYAVTAERLVLHLPPRHCASVSSCDYACPSSALCASGRDRDSY